MKTKVLLGFLIIVLLVGIGCQRDTNTSGNAPSVIDTKTDEQATSEKGTLLDHMISGGPPPDGIPPIEEPQFESVTDVDQWLNNYDMIFVYETSEGVFLFPQRILVWHEIVNMTDKASPVAITYCPLTGSAIGYLYPEGDETSFGTSGSLINSNLLMYDRATDAYISQIDGRGLNLALEAVALKVVPVFWAEWEHAKKTYPDALVLSKETGVLRDYNADPYGSYQDVSSNSYYHNDSIISAFLTGFACCAPTFVILWVSVLGTFSTALIALARWALPIGVILLVLGIYQGVKFLHLSA